MARVNLDRAIFWTPPVPANPEHESRNLQNQDQSQQPSLSKSESRALPRREDEGRKPSSCSGKSIEEAVLILDDDGSDDGSDNDGDDEIIDDLSDISFPSLDEMLGIGPRSRPGTSSVVFGATGNGCSTDSPLADAVEPRLETESRTRSPKSSPLPSVHAKNGLCIAGQAVTDETTCGASAQKTPDAPSAAGRIEQQSEPRQASELSLPHVPVPHFERTVPGFHGEERGSQNLLAHDLSRRTSTASSKSPAPHSEDEGRSPRSNALGDPKNGVIFISDDDDSDDEGDGDNDQSDISFPSLDETLKCTAGPNDFGPGPNLGSPSISFDVADDDGFPGLVEAAVLSPAAALTVRSPPTPCTPTAFPSSSPPGTPSASPAPFQTGYDPPGHARDATREASRAPVIADSTCNTHVQKTHDGASSTGDRIWQQSAEPRRVSPSPSQGKAHSCQDTPQQPDAANQISNLDSNLGSPARPNRPVASRRAEQSVACLDSEGDDETEPLYGREERNTKSKTARRLTRRFHSKRNAYLDNRDDLAQESSNDSDSREDRHYHGREDPDNDEDYRPPAQVDEGEQDEGDNIIRPPASKRRRKMGAPTRLELNATGGLRLRLGEPISRFRTVKTPAHCERSSRPRLSDVVEPDQEAESGRRSPTSAAVVTGTCPSSPPAASFPMPTTLDDNDENYASGISSPISEPDPEMPPSHFLLAMSPTSPAAHQVPLGLKAFRGKDGMAKATNDTDNDTHDSHHVAKGRKCDRAEPPRSVTRQSWLGSSRSRPDGARLPRESLGQTSKRKTIVRKTNHCRRPSNNDLESEDELALDFSSNGNAREFVGGCHRTHDDDYSPPSDEESEDMDEDTDKDYDDEELQPTHKRRVISTPDTFVSSAARQPRPRGHHIRERLTPVRTDRLPPGQRTGQSRPPAIPSPPTSDNSYGEEDSTATTKARYDEWSLQDACLKRVTENGRATFQLEFTWPSCAKHGSGSRTADSRRLVSTTRKRNGTAEIRPSKVAFTADEDALIVELKEGRQLLWEEIHRRFTEKFPGRSKGGLQVRYCSQLKATVSGRTSSR